MGFTLMLRTKKSMITRLGKSLPAAVVLVASLSIGIAGAASKTGHLVLLTSTVPHPVNVSVEPGGVIVWLNQTKNQPLSLTFEGSQSPDPTCGSSVGFARHSPQVLTLPALPPGGTASLCFPTAGTYPYKVYGLDRPISGTITVGASP
jgi:hypothetical protein